MYVIEPHKMADSQSFDLQKKQFHVIQLSIFFKPIAGITLYLENMYSSFSLNITFLAWADIC